MSGSWCGNRTDDSDYPKVGKEVVPLAQGCKVRIASGNSLASDGEKGIQFWR